MLAVEDYLSESSDNSKLVLYPNPTKNLINIKLNDYLIDEVVLYDISGKKLKSFTEKNSIDISNFAAGIYILKIRSENQVFESKIIKQL